MRERLATAGGEQFRVSVDSDGVTLFVRLYGELDLTCEERFNEEVRNLDKKHFDRVLFDLSGLTFIDSSGLWLLHVEFQRIKSAHLEVAILRGSDQARSILETTGLNKVMPVVEAGRA
jgi:anti-anti-sigma factor